MTNSTTTSAVSKNIIRCYVLPVIIILGSCLNLLSFFVMKRIGSTTSFFMSILGLVDTFILLVGGINTFLNELKQSILFISNISCKIFPFIIYSMLDLSVTIIIIMNAERTYAVACPLVSRRSKFSKKNTIWILFTALVFCMILNSHFIYTHSLIDFNSSLIVQTEEEELNYNFKKKENEGLKGYMCTAVKWLEFYDNYWVYIDGAIYSFIPFGLLAVLNTMLIFCLMRSDHSTFHLKSQNSISLTPRVSFENSSATPKYKNTLTTLVHYNSSKSSISFEKIYASNTQQETESRYGSSLKVINDTVGKACRNSVSEDVVCRKHSLNYSKNNKKLKEIMKRRSSEQPRILRLTFGNHKENDLKNDVEEMKNYFKTKRNERMKSENGFDTNIQIPNGNRSSINGTSVLLNRKKFSMIRFIDKRLTITLFLVSISFFMMTMPMVVLQIIEAEYFFQIADLKFQNDTLIYNHILKLNQEIDYFDLLKSIAELLQYLNHSINFILYVISGKTFRNETKKFLSRLIRKPKRENQDLFFPNRKYSIK
jgi:hypothetical protein